MAPRPVQAMLLVARLGARRQVNRLLAGGWWARRGGPAAPEGARMAVARKRPARVWALSLFAIPFFVFQVALQTRLVVVRAVNDESAIGDQALECLRWADEAPLRASGNGRRTRYLRSCFERDMRSRAMGKVDPLRVEQAMGRYETLGSASFRRAPSILEIGAPETSKDVERAYPTLLMLAAVVATWLCLTTTGSADARQFEDELAWLYQLPVPASVLLGAKAIASGLLQPSAWIVGAPMMFTIARMCGFGWGAYGFAVWAALQLGAVAGSAELITPLVLRRLLQPATVRTLQGAGTLVGTMGLVTVFLLANRPGLGIHGAPSWLALLPGAGLVAVAAGSPSNPRLIALGIAWVVLPPFVAAMAGGAVLKRGLVVTSGKASTPRPSRERDASTLGWLGPGPPWWRGIAGKEARWLFRDRRALLIVVLMPFLMVVPRLLLGGHGGADADPALSTVPGAATASFVGASYAFAFSAANGLVSEGGALWVLYTLPRTLARTLLDKVAVWSCVGILEFVIIDALEWGHTAHRVDAPLYFAVAAGGVVIFAFTAAALGVLAADPLAATPRTMGVGLTYTYVILIAAFASALYRDSLYAKLTSLAFFSLLALALWQKVRDRLAYLLDPAARPPPALEVSDAILIAVAFCLAQMLLGLALAPFDLGLFERVSVVFFVSGATVTAGAFAILQRAKVPGLLRTVGLAQPDRMAKVAGTGCLAVVVGVAVGAAGRFYGRSFFGEAPLDLDPGTLKDLRWFRATAVLGAPFFEELIFRGFLYGSLRRLWPRWAAALASATAFAACHPPAAVAPVLVVGLLAAWLFEMSDSLAPSIALHTAYNTFLLSGLCSN